MYTLQINFPKAQDVNSRIRAKHAAVWLWSSISYVDAANFK